MAFADKKERESKLREIRRAEEEDLARILSEKRGLPYTDLSVIPVHIEALTLITEDRARKAHAAAFLLSGKKVSVGVLSPDSPETEAVFDDLKNRGFEIVPHIVSEYSLLSAWSRYKETGMLEETEVGAISVKNETILDLKKRIVKIADIKNLLGNKMGDKGSAATHVLEVFVAGALATKASDIHFEPEEGSVRARFRLDGVLGEIATLSHEDYKRLLSRIKLLSGLKLNITKEAQDGRFTIHTESRDIEIRTSALPGAFGETIVLRLLDPETLALRLEDLGMDEKLLSFILQAIEKPDGLLLNTGPTGSGKTTTLYAFLSRVNKPGINIVTIEDPIEYHLPGITQTQIKKGYGFDDGMRAALRQDPDIIMVGEIRDRETAQTAIHASLTGHLVFSTLHTNNAAGAIPRLLDLGADNKVLPDALSVTMAQRLVRRLCVSCKNKYEASKDEKNALKEALTDVPESYKKNLPDFSKTIPLWKPVGCDTCHGTGYAGREGVFEAILMDTETEEVVLGRPSERELWKAARHQGLLRMKEHGALKVLSGITDLAELMRVVDIAEK